MDAAGAASNPTSLILDCRLLIFFLPCDRRRRPNSRIAHLARPRHAAFRRTALAGNCQPRPNLYRILRLNSISITARRWPSWVAGTMRNRHLPPEPGCSLATSGFLWNWQEWHSSRSGIRHAVRHLRRALRLDPADSYGNDFLGTVYFLQGNLEAALKYWNRVGKPQIAEIRSQPAPQVNAALLDRALAFAPASVLRLPDLLTTEVRIRWPGDFPQLPIRSAGPR